MNKRMVFLILAMINIAIFSGCVQLEPVIKNGGNATIPESTQELKKFSSAYELREYLKASAGRTDAFNAFGGDLTRAESKMVAQGRQFPNQHRLYRRQLWIIQKRIFR